jgi:hypothetical protein
MSDHQSETAFLRRCILYDESAGRLELEKTIIRIERDERRVGRAVLLTAMLTALAVAGLGYGAMLGDNFPYNTPQFIITMICVLGTGSLISLMIFVVLGMIYRRNLDQRREECRQLVSRLLESRSRIARVEVGAEILQHTNGRH